MSAYDLPTDQGDYFYANTLARLADCGEPSDNDGAGASWLNTVYCTARGHAEYANENDMTHDDVLDDDVSELADSVVPVYTRDLWAVFVDLAAYREDVSELGFEFDPTNHDRLPMTALYMIADRLIRALLDEWVAADDTETVDA